MDFINPLANAVQQSSQLQLDQGAERARHVRKMQAMEKDVAARDEEMEHQVESTEELNAIQDDGESSSGGNQQHPSKKKKGGAEEDERPHLDLKA